MEFKTKIDRPTPLFVVIAVLYAVLLIISNVIVGRPILIFGLVFSSAIMIYPMVWIISDIMTEVYGMRLSLLSIRLNVISNLLMALFFTLAISLPYPSSFKDNSAFYTIMHQTPRIVVSSLIAYFLGDYLNSATLSLMKTWHGENLYGLRCIISTMAGQLADTVLFMFLAFYRVLPTPLLISISIHQYVAKVLYEVVMLPLTYKITGFIKRIEGVSVIDERSWNTYKPL